MTHAELMDSIYRRQRAIYDLTRKYYLLGRDRLLREMRPAPDHRVLEVGCGTARNLRLLARLAPGAHLYGLDISSEMLLTAQQKIARVPGLPDRITLALASADHIDRQALFGLGPDQGFHHIFFSYSLSMIPPWPESLLAAAQNLAPGGTLWIVDFWDQGRWPAWFRGLLQRWLTLFHVRHEPALLATLRHLAANNLCTLQLDSVHGQYAYLARLTNLDPTNPALAPAILAGKSYK